MRSEKIALLVVVSLIVLSSFLLASCAKKECESARDCGVNSQCITYGCSAENKCLKNVKPNCCGNKICEENSGENACTCDDCGSCEKKGKVKYNVSTSRGPKTMESKFARYVCDANECVIGVSPDDVIEQKLTSTLEERNYFRMEVLNTFNEPYNVNKDQFSVRIRLADINTKTVNSGLTVTSLQVLNGNYVMGEKIISKQLLNVGDLFTEEFTLTSSQTMTEEESSLSLKIDYSYVPVDSRGNLLDIKRASQKMVVSPSKIMIVKP
ncbi:hypothetical protein JW826_03950 [Candidatus Woesearchaeota archaeon]|nr:hypothetical protein [Candidatus Woesearchaeota archaeon]